jgi:phage/plasmid-associated DNA primase
MDKRNKDAAAIEAEFYSNEPAFINEPPPVINKFNNDSDGFIDEDIYNEDPIDNTGVEEIIQNKISKPIRDLKNFLNTNNFMTEKGNQKTNLINVAEKKTYNLPTAFVEEFFTIMDDCRKENRLLHFSERQETDTLSHSGIMIDFDRYQRSREAQITPRHFTVLSNRITKILREFIDFTPASTNSQFVFRIFYIRKPAVLLTQNGLLNGDVYKDGFHILIPEIQIVKGLKRHLLNELITRGVIKTTFKDIEHMEDADKMLDKLSASNPVHFFGNSKPSHVSYILTHAHEITIDMDSDEYERKDLDVKKLLSGLKDTAEESNINLTYELSLSFYIPLIKIKNKQQSTWLMKRNFQYLPSLETKIQLIVERTHQGVFSDNDIISSDNSVDILTLGNAEAKYIKNLLAIIDISYASEYEKWFKIICAIAHTNVNYKPLAMWFSQRVPEKWSQSEIDRVWNEATNNRTKKNPITKRSLIHLARESSPHKLREIDKENYVELLAKYVYQNEGRVEHAMAARVVYSMLSEKFIVDVGYNEKSGRTGYCWFEFVSPGQAMRRGEVYKWRKEIEPDNVHLFISEHLPKVYVEQAQRIRERKDNAKDEAEAKYWANVERTFRQYMSKLSNDGFQIGIVKQAQYKFRVRGFMDDLDQDEDLIGVGNGILKIGAEPKFIQGFHEYKVSKYTETEYIDKPFNPYGHHEAKLLQWARDIFPEPDMNAFMWMHASTGLDFCESACIILLLVGGGQNGKSSWAKMIHNTLGNQYCAAGKSALLTSSIERGESANSAQMQSRDKRYFYFDEFNKCEEINTARLKSIVNPGWQSGRDLREKQTNFRNTTNPVALSNYDFIITTTDHGTWRRIYYYRNKNKFCKNPNPENINEKLADERFIHEYPNDPAYKTATLSIMTHYYSILCREYNKDIKNIPVPTIQKETEEFRNRQDALNRFITQMIVKSPTSEITLQSFCIRYNDWYGRNVKTVALSMNDIQSQLENSRISAHLESRSNSVKVIVGHRLKSTLEEPLEPGELEMIQIKQLNGDSIGVSVTENGAFGNATTRHINTPIITDGKANDGYIRDLLINAPKHIQNTTDNISDKDDAAKIILDSFI